MSSPPPAPAALAIQLWLPGLADIDLHGTPVVGPDEQPIFRHVTAAQASRSRAVLLPHRLDLKVAPGDEDFAVQLIAAFAAPDGRPAASAPASRALLALAARVARAPVSVLIEGATGTGKEGLARLVHDQSPRRDGPFVAVNSAALSESMLEAALFGHERGAFTGAQAASCGLVRAAHGGTLFLDEVAELPPLAQAKLLRVLQEREVLPVGAVRAVPVDVRIVAAGNRDLASDVASGRFRADLYHRLAVFPLRTLPLAQRRPDIIAIAAHLLLQHGQGPIAWPTEAALARLMAHDWPGNARELGNVLDRAMILGSGAVITPADLMFDTAPAAALPAAAWPVAVPHAPLPGQVRAHEQSTIRRALAEAPSRRAAALRLGISERTLRYKLAGMATGKATGTDHRPLFQ